MMGLIESQDRIWYFFSCISNTNTSINKYHILCTYYVPVLYSKSFTHILFKLPQVPNNMSTIHFHFIAKGIEAQSV